MKKINSCIEFLIVCRSRNKSHPPPFSFTSFASHEIILDLFFGKLNIKEHHFLATTDKERQEINNG
jgi:hypothetical protein